MVGQYFIISALQVGEGVGAKAKREELIQGHHEGEFMAEPKFQSGTSWLAAELFLGHYASPKSGKVGVLQVQLSHLLCLQASKSFTCCFFFCLLQNF